MKNGESIGSENSNTEQNPWQKMAEEVPPFNGNKNNKKHNAEDYYEYHGVEYLKPSSIDVSTEQGKFEFLDTIISNDSDALKLELEDLDPEWDRQEFEDKKEELARSTTQQKILERLDPGSEISIMGQLDGMLQRVLDAMDNPNATEKARSNFDRQRDAIVNLRYLLYRETSERDPKCLSLEKIGRELEDNVGRAEREIEKTKADGYIGEDGFIHKVPGEKFRTIMTEDAEIDLAEAKQDAATFDQLERAYDERFGFERTHPVEKKDFIPIVETYIANHTELLNQINDSIRGLDKNSPTYAEKIAERKKLAKERSSARRLLNRYFI